MSAPVRQDPGTAVATRARNPIVEILAAPNARNQIAPLIPHGVSYDRIMVEVYHAAQKNPDILKCTPASIIAATAKCVAVGLVIGETIHLVPFGSTLEAVRDYKGDIELVMRSGAARAVDGHCVYANETFKVTQGTQPSVHHVPIMDPKARGPMVGAYAYALLPFGHLKVFTMSLEEIEQVRQTYSKSHKRGAMPYWYPIKTCIHRVCKTLPKNEKLAATLALFDQEEKLIAAGETAEGSEAVAQISAAPVDRSGAQAIEGTNTVVAAEPEPDGDFGGELPL